MYVGRILNWFSKDIGYLDDLLPYIFCEYLLVSLYACMNILCTLLYGRQISVVKKFYTHACVHYHPCIALSFSLHLHTHGHTNYFSRSLFSCAVVVSVTVDIGHVCGCNPLAYSTLCSDVGFLFLLRYYYICSAREVKRLEAIGNTQQLMYMHACYCIHMLSYTCSHLEA